MAPCYGFRSSTTHYRYTTLNPIKLNIDRPHNSLQKLDLRAYIMGDTPQDTQSPNDWKDFSDLEFPKWSSEGAKENQSDSFWTKILGIGKRTRYEDYFIAQLRTVYMDLEGNLRTLIPEYLSECDTKKQKSADEIGKYVKNLLKATKVILENDKLTKRQLLIASSLLCEAEECIVWMTPHAIAFAHIPGQLSQLTKLDLQNKDKYLLMLEDCKNILDKYKGKYEEISKYETEYYRAYLEEIIKVINEQILKDRINTGLQIERLRTLRYWGLILLVFFILIFPLLGNIDKWPPYVSMTGNWSDAIHDSMSFFDQLFEPWIYATGGWLTAFSFCIVGGIGGFISGLLQVRESKTDLGMYEVSVLLFQIRPVFGAFAALISLMLLSWNVLDDVIAGTPGSYLLVAFVSGFSERYFIGLLKLNDEKNTAITNDIETVKEKDVILPKKT
jgi:hypothetical protein